MCIEMRIRMKENYVYPARMEFVDGNYRVRFIDFPDMTCDEEPTKKEVLESARESLVFKILESLDNGEELPKPTESEEDVIYIHIWLPYYRNISKEVYIKKNVTIPQWLDILAKRKKINYSAALVKGLEHELEKDNEK